MSDNELKYIDPSTETALFKDGFRPNGRLGAGNRLTDLPGMSASEMRRREVIGYGLPAKIYGNPVLGCTCRVASLVSATQIVDGMIEADYMCDSGWHNYVVFEVRQYTSESKTQLKIDADGNVIMSTGTDADEKKR